MLDQNEPEVQELKLLSNNNFGLAPLELPAEWIEEEKRRVEDCKNLKFKTKRSKQLKAIARTGIANPYRRRYWFILSGGYELFCKVGHIYDFALEDSKKEPINDKSNFGISFNYMEFVPPQIASMMPTFLHVLWYHNQGIEYSPLIPAIAAMLLMYMEPPLAYLSLQAIINNSRESLFYLLTNKNQFYASIDAIEKLIVLRLPNVANHAQKLGIDFPQLILSMFPSFFAPFISYPVSLTFFDSFVSEGRKVIFRFLLQILIDEKNNLINTSDSSEFDRLIFNAIDRLNDPSIMESFIKKAFKLKMKRKTHIEKLEKMSNSMLDQTKPHLNFSQLHELLPPSNFSNHHRRTKTMDAKAKNEINLLNINDPENSIMISDSLIFNSKASLINAMRNQLSRTSSTENIQMQASNAAQSANITNNNNNSEKLNINDNVLNKSSEKLITPAKKPPKINSNSNSQNLNDNDNNLNTNTQNLNDDDINIPINNHDVMLAVSNSINNMANLSLTASKGRIPSSVLLNQSEIDGVRSIQAQIAQRWLPLIHAHGERNLILNEPMLLALRNQLPPVFRLYSAELAYKMSVHGSYFASLFSHCSYRCQYIMLIRTSEKVIGAFLSDPLQPSKKGKFYGTGMTMVFDADKQSFYKCKTPGKNYYFLSATEDTITIGGPDPAFYLKDGFRKVYSKPCETFNSPMLTESVGGDEICDFEMYKFIPQHCMRQRRKSINSVQKT